MRTGSESSPRFTRPRAFVAAFAFCALLLLAASSLLDAVFVSARLSDAGAFRAALRLSTNLRFPDAYAAASLPESAAPHPGVDASRRFASLKRSRDERLTLAAKDWLFAEESRPSASKRHDVVVGLARWDVDESLAAAFFESRSDAAAFERVSRASFRDERATAEESSRAAAEALSELAAVEPDAALDAALAFLNELGADDAVELPLSASESAEASMLTSFFEPGDPLESAGYVAVRDAASPAALALTTRLCAATSRLFFLLILGAVPFAAASSWSAAFLRVLTALSRRYVVSAARRVAGRFQRRVLRRADALGFLSTVRLRN